MINPDIERARKLAKQAKHESVIGTVSSSSRTAFSCSPTHY